MTIRSRLAPPVLCALLLAAPATAFAASPPAPAAAAEPAVSPAALQALETMSAYLRTLQAFRITSHMTLDEVLDDGQTVETSGTATYSVRRPNAFTIDLLTDRKHRTLFYDGKTLVLSAPRSGYFARVAAPGTIRETLDELDDYGVDVPLEDLFHWGEPGDKRENLTSGIYVGPAHVKGQEADQYAFSNGVLDWQIWIARGDKPVPLRVVITTLLEDARPQFTADLTWETAARFSDADFAFKPPADAKAITFAAGSPTE